MNDEEYTMIFAMDSEREFYEKPFVKWCIITSSWLFFPTKWHIYLRRAYCLSYPVSMPARLIACFVLALLGNALALLYMLLDRVILSKLWKRQEGE